MVRAHGGKSPPKAYPSEHKHPHRTYYYSADDDLPRKSIQATNTADK